MDELANCSYLTFEEISKKREKTQADSEAKNEKKRYLVYSSSLSSNQPNIRQTH